MVFYHQHHKKSSLSFCLLTSLWLVCYAVIVELRYETTCTAAYSFCCNWNLFCNQTRLRTNCFFHCSSPANPNNRSQYCSRGKQTYPPSCCLSKTCRSDDCSLLCPCNY